jgi:hypothetical protein
MILKNEWLLANYWGGGAAAPQPPVATALSDTCSIEILQRDIMFILGLQARPKHANHTWMNSLLAA